MKADRAAKVPAILFVPTALELLPIVRINTGKVIRPPPPAIESIAPASKPVRVKRITVERVIMNGG
jgi:hypothetical protein